MTNSHPESVTDSLKADANLGDLLFEYKGKVYPHYIRKGNACSFIIPYAKEFCKGTGLDVGGFLDWTFPGARAVNITLADGYDAYNLPAGEYDYIFSSHTLEHLPDYVKALDYWKAHIKPGGVLFLYLPHPDMEYWLPQNNRKHLHAFRPAEMVKLLSDLGFKHVFSSERDLYWAFSVVAFV
jgi:SAM-dependent methyltransferase